MTQAPVHAPPAADRNATEEVFESILADIVRGRYPAGARLPAERELSRMLGASRPTLREALRRLAAWQLVDARRGSGVVVRPQREWSVEVLPAYLRYGGGEGQAPASRVLADALAVRSSMLFEILNLVTERIPPGGTEAARHAAHKAWSLRHDGHAYAAADIDVTRELVEAADFLPALWLLNRLASVFEDLARSLGPMIRPPATYLESHERLFHAIEANDAARAVEIAREHFEAHDRELSAFLGHLP
jgi:GntR family transcriptional regulator, transcriptional repressor for pyruvate dehydrogenase complex